MCVRGSGGLEAAYCVLRTAYTVDGGLLILLEREWVSDL